MPDGVFVHSRLQQKKRKRKEEEEEEIKPHGKRIPGFTGIKHS